jgi:hypothetical protein
MVIDALREAAVAKRDDLGIALGYALPVGTG